MELVVTAVTTIAGAALGTLFQELFNGVKRAHREAKEFKSDFLKLKSSLESFQELVEAIEQVENVQPMQGLESFKTKLEEGVELVNKCSKTKNYGAKLRKLDESLQQLFSTLKMHVYFKLRTMVSGLQMSVDRIDRNLVAQNQTENQIRGWCAVPNPPSFPVGLDDPLKDLKMKFLNDDQVSMLVITAPGGCGKTTLARMFCRDKEVKEKFDENIFYVTVSGKPNLNLIVGELCNSTESKVPEFRNEADALIWLQEFLERKGQNDPLLLVLDDVWEGSSKSLLDKCNEFKKQNYKFLVTSRYHFSEFGPPYKLSPLNDEDAMTLFLKTTNVERNKFSGTTDWVERTVELCKGFPLAISVIGNSLRNKPTEIWERRVKELSKCSSILDAEKALLVTLQSSLNALGEGSLVKDCFIDLGSFPEDQKIPATILIDMWSELYGVELDTASIAFLHDLSTCSLASLVDMRNAKEDADGYYNEHFVTQHDILRTLAIHQTCDHDLEGQSKRLNLDICKDKVPNWWTEQNKKPKKTRFLSIQTDGVFSSKWQNIHLPKAEVLVLNFQTKNYAFPKFKKMSKSLKVLIVTNYGVIPAEVSNFTSLGSLSKLKRIRVERISVPPFTKKSILVNSLTKISLFMCNIMGAFGDGSLKFFEAFPNLEEINIDYCSDLLKLPDDIRHLIRLKNLVIANCHKLSALPEMIGQLVNLEVLRLRSCSDLSELPSSVRELKKLKVLDISNCFSIKELPEDIREMCCLKQLNMRQCSRLHELPESILDLKSLTEVICDEHTKGLWEPYSHILRKTIQITVVKEEINLEWLQKQ